MEVADFAQRIRTKFPGEYDSLGDDDLARRVVDKFPEYAEHVSFEPAPPPVVVTGAPQEKKKDELVSPEVMRTHNKPVPPVQRSSPNVLARPIAEPAHERGVSPRAARSRAIVPAHEPGRTVDSSIRDARSGVAAAAARQPMISTSTGKETKNPAISIDQSSDAQFTRLANSVGRGAGGAAAGNYTTGATLLEPATWVDKGFRGLAHLLGFKLDGPGPAEMLQQGARESAASISEDVQADKQREVQQYGSIPLVERVAETGATVALDMGVKYKLASKAISLAGGTPTQSSVMALIGGIDNADKGAVETALGMAGGAVRGKVAAVTQDYGPGVQCGGAGRRGRCLHLRSDGRRGAGRD